LKRWFLVITGLLTGWSSAAKTLDTSYLNLNVPDSWVCENLKPDWICRPVDNRMIHTATLVLTAKVAGPEDTLTAIEQQMKTPRTMTGSNRTPITSQLKWVKEVKLAGWDWIEALHANRELEGFFTYYLATVTSRLIILVNLSFQQNLAKDYQPILEELRRSVRFNAAATESPEEDPATPKPLAPVPVGQPGSDLGLEKVTGMVFSRPLIVLVAIGVVLVLLISLIRSKRRSTRRSKGNSRSN
jgi:hypothetical protein